MNKNFLLNKTTIIAGSAIALLAISAVGSTRAALTQTENMQYNLSVSDLSVDLYELHTKDDKAEYVSVSDGGKLLSTLVGEGENFQIGKTYAEQTAFSNDGNYDAYVRVIITKSWKDGTVKDTTLDPALIDVTMADSGAWYKDEAASTQEREVYYYKTVVAAPERDEDNNIVALDYVPITSAISVKNDVTQIVTKNGTTGNITTTYDYDGKSFDLDIEVDALQTHNAVDAAKASWGVVLNLDSDGSISSVSHLGDSEDTNLGE
ncbi:MAG: hypothetical protein PUF45_10030 [Lachnospiraceae bacterium]|nr:hypothetical protein [Lachnospiraceae bacterium]